MLRRSDFIAARYAFSLVFANFGIAIAARMPMMTTTIRSSMRVKPFLLLIQDSPEALVNRRRLSGPSIQKTRRRETRQPCKGQRTNRNRSLALTRCAFSSYGDEARE